MQSGDVFRLVGHKHCGGQAHSRVWLRCIGMDEGSLFTIVVQLYGPGTCRFNVSLHIRSLVLVGMVAIYPVARYYLRINVTLLHFTIVLSNITVCIKVDDCVLPTKLGNTPFHVLLHPPRHLNQVLVDCIITRINLGWCICLESAYYKILFFKNSLPEGPGTAKTGVFIFAHDSTPFWTG